MANLTGPGLVVPTDKSSADTSQSSFYKGLISAKVTNCIRVKLLSTLYWEIHSFTFEVLISQKKNQIFQV